MKRAVLGIVLLLSPIAAFAQQPQQSPSEQGLTGKLMQEINENIQLRIQIAELQKQLADLKAKYEPPKKEEPKK